MFGRKFKFLCLGLSGCVFQLPFLGCSQDFVAAVLRSFTPAFGESLGEALGGSVGGLLDLGNLGDLLAGLGLT